MKKQMKLILGLLLVFSLALFGCGGNATQENTPSASLTEILKAFQEQDYEKVQELTAGEDAEESASFEEMKAEFAASFSEENKEKAEALMDSIFEKVSGFTYEIKEEVVDGDSATLNVDITNIDMGPAMEQAMTDAFTVAMENMEASEAELETIIFDAFENALNAAEETKTETVEVLMEKDAELDKWVLAGGDENDALLNAVMGYMIDATEME